MILVLDAKDGWSYARWNGTKMDWDASTTGIHVRVVQLLNGPAERDADRQIRNHHRADYNRI